MNEPPVCVRCEEEYSLRDGMEVSKYCDHCAQERVTELEAMSEWIPVEDRLPSRGVLVLVWFGNQGLGYMDVWTYSRSNQYFTDDLKLRKRMNTNLQHCVTHWKPAPEPPK